MTPIAPHMAREFAQSFRRRASTALPAHAALCLKLAAVYEQMAKGGRP